MHKVITDIKISYYKYFSDHQIIITITDEYIVLDDEIIPYYDIVSWKIDSKNLIIINIDDDDYFFVL